MDVIFISIPALFVCFKRRPNHIVEFSGNTMVEKHIIRKENDDEERSHITEIDPKLDSTDPMAVVARTIVFGKDVCDGSKEDAIKEKSEEFKDQINNTTQYLRFINAHLAEKKSKVQKLREDEKRFKEEMASLQTGQITPREELEKVNYKYIKEEETRSLIAHMKTERQMLEEKFAHQQEQIEKTMRLMQEKDEQIKFIENKLETTQKKTKTDDPIAILREEITKLGITDDSARILGAMNSLANMLNSKKNNSG
jgi:chromosome segregation ATPase